MKALPEHVPPDEQEAYDLEVRQLHISSCLLSKVIPDWTCGGLQYSAQDWQIQYSVQNGVCMDL